MNTKTSRSLFVASLLLLVSSGCVAGKRDLARSGDVKVTTEGSPRTQVLTPSVYEDNGQLVISGHVRRSPVTSGEITGHVHIEQLSADGSVIRDSRKPLGTITRRGRTRVASYQAHLPWTPVQGSTIRVSLSGDRHPVE